ncbi:MAG TPA: hypothetical protein VMG10_15270 [Gemmataceae bacterium]|nr:hypothetical protein [Gemmataceae bacterium]
MASLSKNTALLLFCSFRQAERSVHFALTFPEAWPEFLAYYDKAKQTRIRKVIDVLKDAGAGRERVASSQELFEQNGWLIVVRCSAALLCNRFKRSWFFSTRELSFFAATLEHLLGILGLAEPPETDKLIGLRMGCFDCHYIIAGKLLGVPEIRKANAIEHFFQSKHINHVTFQDLGIQCP